jgi:hypothetical protein
MFHDTHSGGELCCGIQFSSVASCCADDMLQSRYLRASPADDAYYDGGLVLPGAPEISFMCATKKADGTYTAPVYPRPSTKAHKGPHAVWHTRFKVYTGYPSLLFMPASCSLEGHGFICTIRPSSLCTS